MVNVNPGNMDGWAVQTNGTATVTFEPGPAVPPLGEGSVELAVGTNGNSGAQVRNFEYAGTQLSDLTTLRYSTYVDNDSTNPLAGPDQAPYLILNVDLDGNLSTTGDRTLLFFEPEYQFGYTAAVPPQGPIVMDTWQTWDALAGGWWSTTGAAGAGPGADVKPLSAIIAAYPNATIVNSGTDGLTGLGGVRIVAGFGAGAWDNFVGNADAFIIGVNGDTTTYNFDPGPVITSITDSPDPSDEGESVTVTATFTDAAPNVVYTATIDWGDGTGPQPATYNPITGEVTGTHTYVDDNPSGTPSDPYTITVTVTDPLGNTGVGTTQHTVANVDPVVQTMTGPMAPQPVGTPVTVSATFTDQGTNDTHTATIDWGDGTVTAGVVTEAGGSGQASGTYTYTVPGVYVVTVTITDDDSGSDSMSSDEAVPIPFFVVIFDAQGGFVTGGGWYDSPAGAAPAAPAATGKANFGLNARYHTGEIVPHGQVHLNFKEAGIKFRSTELTFLGVAGNTATIRGEGTNNNTGLYAFRLEATDEGEPGRDDTFHIKIWQKVDPAGAIETFVLYDNVVPTPLGGGNIQIHMDSNGMHVDAGVELSGGHPLTTEALERAFGEAITWWATKGVDSEAVAALAQTKLHVVNLPDSWLGLAGNAAVGIDADAAGMGWAINGASSGLDLATVVTHELGHLLGLEHDEDHDSVMAATLEPGSSTAAALRWDSAAVMAMQPLSPVSFAAPSEAVRSAEPMGAVAFIHDRHADPIAWAESVTPASANRLNTESAWPLAPAATGRLLSWGRIGERTASNVQSISQGVSVPPSWHEERETRSIEPALPIGTEEAWMAGPPLSEDSVARSESDPSVSRWDQACDDYFAGEQWEIGLRDAAVAVAGLAIIAACHSKRVGEESGVADEAETDAAWKLDAR